MREWFHRFAWRVSERVGSPHAFLAALVVFIIVILVAAPQAQQQPGQKCPSCGSEVFLS